MRRRDREVTDEEKIDSVIRACHCVRIGFNDDGEVYIIPLNFGFVHEDNGKRIFYFHGANEGRKIDLIKKCPYVGFELDTGYEQIYSDIACKNSARFQSIIGNGNMSIIEDVDEKRTGLISLMIQSTKKTDWEISDAMLNAVTVFKLEVEKLSCKEHE